MSDIVERLRQCVSHPEKPSIAWEAAAEIESLRARLVIESKAREGREALLRENESLRKKLAEAIACIEDVLDADGDLHSMDFNRYRAFLASRENERAE